MATTATVNQVLDGQVALDLECLDRVYLNAYVPKLQVGGQVVSFLTQHLGYPIPSPAIFDKIGTGFRRAVSRFAEDGHIPVVRFTTTDRKIETMRPYLAAQAATGRSGVAAIGVAQEYASVFTATRRAAPNGIPWFAFAKAQRRVTCYYFYLWDLDFGPAFIKICAYFPYPAKIWLNGHEWAKRQAARAGIGFTELSNGFAATADPTRLQDLCDRLAPAAIGVFADRWFALLPTPLTDADRAAGYWWELSMRQIEVSRTIVFTQPRHARGFFEALVADNLDLGRPEQVELIFSGRPVRAGRRRTTPEVFKTKVVTRGTEVTVNAFYKHSRIKQYLNDGRALRVETVVNDPPTWAASAGCPTSTSCRPGPAPPTTDCSILNGSARAASSRVQPLSGSRTPRSPRTGGGPQPCGSATLGCKPWPARCASACSPSPASPTRACAPG